MFRAPETAGSGLGRPTLSISLTNNDDTTTLLGQLRSCCLEILPHRTKNGRPRAQDADKVLMHREHGGGWRTLAMHLGGSSSGHLC